MIVAIDGPAGSGKSTIARELSRRLGFEKLDTGAMYRAVALTALRRGVDLDDEAGVDDLASRISITFAPVEGAASRILVDGTDVTSDIRTPEVDANVSKVSAYAGVRCAMVAQQRVAADDRDVVAEGRDIGTVVFPAADVKVFLCASPEARARRRAVQRLGGNLATGDVVEVDAEAERTILDDLVRRDAYDSSREASPLRPADDARRIDSSDLGFEEVVDAVVSLSPELAARAQKGRS